MKIVTKEVPKERVVGFFGTGLGTDYEAETIIVDGDDVPAVEESFRKI